MRNPIFHFKQFSVQHDLCGMKVGADGVLLGAWAKHPDPKNILDVGSGSGLLSLMLAQKYPQASITGIDINALACRQSEINFKNSPFTNHFNVQQISFQDFKEEFKFDLIVANLPFYQKSVEITDLARAQARLEEFLPLEVFFSKAINVLSKKGAIQIIYPHSALEKINILLQKLGLFINRICKVKGTPEAPIKRLLLDISYSTSEMVESELILESSRNIRTHDYQELTKAYYL